MRNAGQKKRSSKQKLAARCLVGAGGLDVAGLLALVADAVVADLSGAVARKVADLTACGCVSTYAGRMVQGQK